MSRIAPSRTMSFPIATQERHTCISGWLGRALGLWQKWREEAPEVHERPRIHNLREILNAVFYALKSGCQ